MKSDISYGMGLIIVLLLLIVTLSGCVEQTPPSTTTTIVVTTQSTTTTPTVITSSSTSTSTTTTTTQPITISGDDVKIIDLEPSSQKPYVGNHVDLMIKILNVETQTTVNITQIELHGVDFQMGSSGYNVWGVTDGDLVITPNKFLYPREYSEHWWDLQAPSRVDNQTKVYLTARVYYIKGSTKYYVDSSELLITIHP